MEPYGPSTYGDHVADVFDETLPMSESDTAAAVEVLRALAGAGPALELGVGTGRIAIPLAARGIEVRGIEGSERMLERLRERRGSELVEVSLGDFAAVDVEGSFALVYAVFNTFSELYTEADQLRCLENAAARLAGGGVLVLELTVPEPPPADVTSRVAVSELLPDRVTLVAWRHDAETGATDSVEIWLSEDGVRLFPLRERLISPEEVDRLAARAGLKLRERWAGWRREPFGPESRSHVSVYARAG